MAKPKTTKPKKKGPKRKQLKVKDQIKLMKVRGKQTRKTMKVKNRQPDAIATRIHALGDAGAKVVVPSVGEIAGAVTGSQVTKHIYGSQDYSKQYNELINGGNDQKQEIVGGDSDTDNQLIDPYYQGGGRQ